ncbi:GlxA family transcriptional regulator [Embleya sp. NPDC050493]|uniref:GlxA family transcriptional regulator n=1 Tax=Embleya sp. NPDC050493 TaxID=3363989 RepID=UPI0037A68F91
MTGHRVAFLIFDDFEPLDLVGPHSVFSHVPDYTSRIVALRAGPVRGAGGLPVHADTSLADLEPPDVDTLMVVGGPGVRDACADPTLVDWIADTARSAPRIASVCTGVFLLAAAGLIDGHRVTTHWRRAEELARAHPDAIVDADPIFVRHGRLWTSAGVAAGMDLALALVEHDHGHEVAHRVARDLVLFLRRPGSQSQFSVPLWSARPASRPLRAAVDAVHADPGARHTIDELARRCGLSPRHFQRRFTADLGIPPAGYVERVRVEAARRALAESDEPIDTVARRCGFGSAETLRRTFHRHLGVPPSDYRDRFRTTDRNDRSCDRRATDPPSGDAAAQPSPAYR